MDSNGRLITLRWNYSYCGSVCAGPTIPTRSQRSARQRKSVATGDDLRVEPITHEQRASDGASFDHFARLLEQASTLIVLFVPLSLSLSPEWVGRER